MAGRPDSTSRTVILGGTGTGKTQFAMGEILLKSNFDKMPWVILDYKKEDPIINSLVDRHKLPEVDFSKDPPKKPGLYIAYPLPSDDDAVNSWLWKVWERGRLGLYVDEGYLLPQSKKSAFSAILTQGRAKHIPVVVLYQRPFDMNLLTISQASYIAVFPVHRAVDQKRIKDDIPPAILPAGTEVTPYNHRKLLPKYYPLWHDVAEGETCVLIPAKSQEAILAAFAARLSSKRDIA